MGWLDTLNAGLESFNEGVDSLDRWLYKSGLSPDALWFGKPPGAPGGAQMGVSDVVPGIAALPPSKGPGPKLPRGARPPRPPKTPAAPPAAPAPEPTPTPRQFVTPELLARAKSGDERAIEELMTTIRPMLLKTARRHGSLPGPRRADPQLKSAAPVESLNLSEDALQSAYEITLRDLQTADPAKPGEFVQLLKRHFARDVPREMSALAEAAPLSMDVRDLTRRIERFRQKYYQKTGVRLQDDRVIKKMKLSPHQVALWQEARQSPALAPKIELDRPRPDYGDAGLHDTVTPQEHTYRTPSSEIDTVAGGTATPEQRVTQKSYRDAIAFAMRQARREDPRKARIWAAFEEGVDQKTIGQRYNVSNVAIHKALESMRQRIADIARARIEGRELPAPPRRKPGGGGGPAKPFGPPKRPPIQGGSDADIEFIGVQEGFGSVPEVPLWNLKRDFPGHPAGSTVGPETLRRLGIEPPPIPPRSVGAAAYQNPMDDVQKFVDEYRRFVMTGGLDKAPDPEIVRQLQSKQKTQINPHVGFDESQLLLQHGYPEGNPSSLRSESLPPIDAFQPNVRTPYVGGEPVDDYTRMTMPYFRNSTDPTPGALTAPMFDIRDEITIPRPGPRGIPPKLPGAGAEGNPYTTPLDPDQRIQLKGVNVMGANLSGGASYDTSRYPENFKAEMMRPDRLRLMENAKNLRDFHAPADDVLPFNDPEGFMQYLRDMIRMNMGHN